MPGEPRGAGLPERARPLRGHPGRLQFPARSSTSKRPASSARSPGCRRPPLTRGHFYWR